jgi:hypothetical protein
MEAHAALVEELKEDLKAYTRGGQSSFPISDALWDSVSRWPVATEEFVVYRGQPKPPAEKKKTMKHLPLPLVDLYNKRPFFSTSMGLDVAKTFAKYAYPEGDVFKITVKPGIRYLVLTTMGEAEILVAGDGVAEYGDAKVKASNEIVKNLSVWPVTYSPRPPKPTGGRRKTRRRSLRRNR